MKLQNDIENKLVEIDGSIRELVDYIHLKIKKCDWHAISDVANDIRDLEAEKVAYNDVLSKIK